MILALLALALLGARSALAHGSHHHHHHHGDGHDHGHDHGHDEQPAQEGWGPYAWRSLAEGEAESKATGKPIMLVISKTWCSACKALRPKFAASAAIAAEAPGFVMVHTVDDEEPKEELYKPGGAGYIPRVLFLAPGGGSLLDVTSGNSKYAYFYGDDGAIASAMRTASAKSASASKVDAEFLGEAAQDL